MTRRLAAVLLLVLSPAVSFAQRGAPPPDGRAGAPIDLTGYWVSVVTEDWRYRMVTPTKGDYQGVPMTPEAIKLADGWDPAADTAAGNQCKSYGAPAIMRVPGRLHVTWDDDTTLHVDADAGTQTRIFRFGPPRVKGEPSWQGESVASWDLPGRGRGRGTQPPPPPPGARGAATGEPGPRGGAPGGAPPRPPFGSLKVVTTNLRAGYLRKNGVPYSENASVTEYFDIAKLRSGEDLLVVTTIVEDPRYLAQPFITSTQFKKQRDAAGWEPTPCSTTW